MSVHEANDQQTARHVADALIRHAGSREAFVQIVTQLIRQAIDEVIDTPRTNRFTLDEIEKTEKTYIGTKIEILFRNHMSLPKGAILDVCIDGIETDIKYTIGSNWTIPQEAMSHPCILIRANEKKGICSTGIVVIRLERLNEGQNRDGKRTISKSGFDDILWLLKDTPYPMSFWEMLPPDHRLAIMAPKGGTERLANLFRLVQRVPISRRIIESIAQQDDYMKRLRKNGGARDILSKEGIAVLWGQKDKDLIDRLGLPLCNPDEFISVQPEDESEIDWLRQAQHIN